MNMTTEEIVNDYKRAKKPMKQIKILADLNQCTKDEIVEILRGAGCKLPGQYAVAEAVPAETAPAAPAKEETPAVEEKVPVVAEKHVTFFEARCTIVSPDGEKDQIRISAEADRMYQENGFIFAAKGEEIVAAIDMGILLYAEIDWIV